jgi:hypothetical protein
MSSQPDWKLPKAQRLNVAAVRLGVLFYLGSLLGPGFSFAQTATAPASPSAGAPSASAPAQRETEPDLKKPRSSRDRAWLILHEGLSDSSVEKRAKAVGALGTLTANAEGEKAAKQALQDEKFPVRVAAATALGEMHAMGAIPDLEKALDDAEPTVVLAAANSLMSLKDSASAYDIYYGVLTGEMRTNRGLVQEQLKTLHDSKKLAQIGFEEGISFVPFAGVGYGVMKTVMKNDASTMRAVAAKKLAHDPDPASAAALVGATQDKSAIVRVAAVQALAERGDKGQLHNLVLAMDDDKDEVRYNAAAAVIHLNESRARGKRVRPPTAGSKAAPTMADANSKHAVAQPGTGR